MVAHMRSVNDLPEAPSEGRKIRRFCAAWDDGDQPASSYHLPVRGTSADILLDIDDLISSTTTGMRSKKVSELLHYSGVRSQ